MPGPHGPLLARDYARPSKMKDGAHRTLRSTWPFPGGLTFSSPQEGLDVLSGAAEMHCDVRQVTRQPRNRSLKKAFSRRFFIS